jgi:hypothetical protein
MLPDSARKCPVATSGLLKNIVKLLIQTATLERVPMKSQISRPAA